MGERGEAFVTIVASLGLALVADMERNNMFAPIVEEMKAFQNGLASMVEVGVSFVDS